MRLVAAKMVVGYALYQIDCIGSELFAQIAVALLNCCVAASTVGCLNSMRFDCGWRLSCRATEL